MYLSKWWKNICISFIGFTVTCSLYISFSSISHSFKLNDNVTLLFSFGSTSIYLIIDLLIIFQNLVLILQKHKLPYTCRMCIIYHYIIPFHQPGTQTVLSFQLGQHFSCTSDLVYDWMCSQCDLLCIGGKKTAWVNITKHPYSVSQCF